MIMSDREKWSEKGEKAMIKYITPEMEIIEFDAEDVILTSIPAGGSGDGDSGKGKWGAING